MMKFQSICNKLIDEAQNSQIQYRLASCLIQNNKIISKPKCNILRGYCRGNFCGSLHSEARTILSYFGNQINWDQKYGWRFQTVPRKKGKKT